MARELSLSVNGDLSSASLEHGNVTFAYFDDSAVMISSLTPALGPVLGGVEVTLQSEDGTARGYSPITNATANSSSSISTDENFDFVHMNALTLVFESGERSKTAYLELLDDELFETAFETLTVKIIAVAVTDGGSGTLR